MKLSLFTVPTLFVALATAGLVLRPPLHPLPPMRQTATRCRPAARSLCIASDTALGPDMERYRYRRTLLLLDAGQALGFRRQRASARDAGRVMRDWSVLTYRCVTPEIEVTGHTRQSDVQFPSSFLPRPPSALPAPSAPLPRSFPALVMF